MTLRQRMELNLKQKLTLLSPEAMIGLYDLDISTLPELLEQAKSDIIEYKSLNPGRSNGNYIFSSSFHDLVKDFKKSNLPEQSKPLFLTDNVEERLESKYNPEISDLIDRKLSGFKSKYWKAPGTSFTGSLSEILEQMIAQQKSVVDYVANEQKEFLDTLDPFKLKYLNQQKVADVTNIDPSTLNKYLKHLTVELPSIGNIMVKELIPGQTYGQIQVCHALNLLKEDKNLYEGDWKVSIQKLSEIMKERFDISYARRTVWKYNALLSQKNSQKNISADVTCSDPLYDTIWEDITYMKDNPCLCKDNKWCINAKQFSKLFTKEYNRNVSQEFMENLLADYKFITDGPAPKK